MRVLVLAGGRSAEREISLVSAKWVIEKLIQIGHEVIEVHIEQNGLWKTKFSSEELSVTCKSIPWSLFLADKQTKIDFDVVFPVLHGSYGEDGTFQGFCATAGWACAGASVLGSAVAMEKSTFKKLARDAGIPVVPWISLDESTVYSDDLLESCRKKLGFPVFVKPSRLGSSVGVSKADSLESLMDSITKASVYDKLILVEKAVQNAREIEVSVMGNGSVVKTSLPGEVIAGKEWYDFEAKYRCDESKLEIPAAISEATTSLVRELAEKAFRLIGAQGFARVDFFINEDGIWLNEINTIPGFTSISMFPKLWEASGVYSKQLFNFILNEAVTRDNYGLGGKNNV